MSLTFSGAAARIADAVRREVYDAIRAVNLKMDAIVAGPWDGRVDVLPVEPPPEAPK